MADWAWILGPGPGLLEEGLMAAAALRGRKRNAIRPFRPGDRIEPGYSLRFIKPEQVAELVNLYHLARVPKGTGATRHERMIWASNEFSKAHPGVSSTAVYKDLDGILTLGYTPWANPANPADGVQFVLGITRHDRGPKGGVTQIQSIMFDKDLWTREKAAVWLKAHDLRSGDSESQANFWRFRQLDPADFEEFRVIGAGVGNPEWIGYWRIDVMDSHGGYSQTVFEARSREEAVAKLNELAASTYWNRRVWKGRTLAIRHPRTGTVEESRVIGTGQRNPTDVYWGEWSFRPENLEIYQTAFDDYMRKHPRRPQQNENDRIKEADSRAFAVMTRKARAEGVIDVPKGRRNPDRCTEQRNPRTRLYELASSIELSLTPPNDHGVLSGPWARAGSGVPVEIREKSGSGKKERWLIEANQSGQLLYGWVYKDRLQPRQAEHNPRPELAKAHASLYVIQLWRERDPDSFSLWKEDPVYETEIEAGSLHEAHSRMVRAVNRWTAAGGTRESSWKYATFERQPDGSYVNTDVYGVTPSRFIRKRGRANPESDAASLYEDFHGRPPSQLLSIATKIHEPDELAGLGELVEVKVHTLSGLEATLGFRDNPPLLCASPDGRQLYFQGGDQFLDLHSLKMDGEEWERASMVIGVLTELTYSAEKKFHRFKLTDYFHHVGEETGVQPMLLYDPASKLLAVSGGQYRVSEPGIEN